MHKEGSSSKAFFITIIIIVAAISGIIVFPFLTSIVTGALLAFIFYPFYEWLRKKTTYKGVAAFVTAVIIVLLVTVPTVLIINNFTKESHYLYLRTKQQIMGGEFIEDRCYEDNFICNSAKSINNLLKDENVKTYSVNLLNDFINFITKKISNLIFSLPKIILHLIIMLFTTYYLLKDGKELVNRISRVAPLKVRHQEEIMKQFGEVTNAIIYGSFIVALVQGTLGAFGFWVFGFKSFISWAILMTFFALIPFIGTWVVWFPASVYLGLTGYLQSETTMMWKGIGLFFYGLLIISTIDNILKPIIVAGRAKVHPLLILIGILGGLFIFGLIGLILGPLILALFQTLITIYERERRPHITEKEEDILGRKNHNKN